MLIVNADDWGHSTPVTDATLDFCRRGAVTAVSAMTFMADSERAALIAQQEKIDVGLHLNFSEAFSGPHVPAEVQRAQSRIARHLNRTKYALIIYHPLLRRSFRLVCRAQQAEFVRLYGRPPSHVDGHLHFHLATNLLLNPEIPRGTFVRRSFTFSSGEKSLFNRLYRRFVDRSLSRRYRLVDFFFALPQNHHAERMEHICRLAEHSTVELMTHPVWPAETTLLSGATFRTAVGKTPLTSFSKLVTASP